MAPQNFDNPTAERLTTMIQHGHVHSKTKVPIRPIVPRGCTIALSDRHRHKSIWHWEFVLAAYNKGLLFQVFSQLGQLSIEQPLFMGANRSMNNHSLLLPGDSFEFQELPINHNKNATSVVLPELPNLSVFVHAYKNDPMTFRHWIFMA